MRPACRLTSWFCRICLYEIKSPACEAAPPAPSSAGQVSTKQRNGQSRNGLVTALGLRSIISLRLTAGTRSRFRRGLSHSHSPHKTSAAGPTGAQFGADRLAARRHVHRTGNWLNAATASRASVVKPLSVLPRPHTIQSSTGQASDALESPRAANAR